MMYDLIVGGYVSMDRVVKLEQPAHVGKTSIIAERAASKIHYGGCGMNVGVALSKLEKNVLPLIRVGEDFEATGYKAFLEATGMDLRHIEKVPGELTSYAYLIENPDKEHITLFYPGAMSERYASDYQDVPFQKARYALMTVGSQKDNVAYLKQLKQHGVPLFFGMKMDEDAFPKPFLDEILDYASVVFMNRSEAEDLRRLFHLETIEELLERDNLEALLITEGAQGSTCLYRADSLRRVHVNAAKPDVLKDTSGSGDAYIAGFLYGYLQNEPWKRCAEYGSVTASFVIEEIGCTANAPDKEALLQRHEEQFKEETS